MKRRTGQAILAISIVVLTVLAGLYYFRQHAYLLHQLALTPPLLLLSLLGLYIAFMVSLWLVFRGSLAICEISLPAGETMLVTAYSSIINFFGPLQSGPAFRALYLKQRHAVGLKKYALASLLYYLFYAFFSGLCLAVGFIGWWAGLVGFSLLLAAFSCLRFLPKRLLAWRQLRLSGVMLTAGATLLQVSLFAVIFYVELHSVNQAVSWQQAIVYTGAANFALFVSITPAAIGFRESFVLATQGLHHIPSSTIVSASLLDRGVYVAMLVLLAVFIFGSQARATIKRLTS